MDDNQGYGYERLSRHSPAARKRLDLLGLHAFQYLFELCINSCRYVVYFKKDARSHASLQVFPCQHNGPLLYASVDVQVCSYLMDAFVMLFFASMTLLPGSRTPSNHVFMGK